MANNGYRTPARRTLVGAVGAIAASLLFVSIPADESGRTVSVRIAGDVPVVTHVRGPQYLSAYLDLVGVPTACDGITRGVRMGQRYTEAQCTVLLESALIEHADGVRACAPALWQDGRDRPRAAAVSLAYNIGVSAFCSSTVARRFRAGEWARACDAFLMWNKAGRPLVAVRGLTLRRERERALCRTGLPV